jgi:hypothetical protein
MNAQFKLWFGVRSAYRRRFGEPPHWLGELGRQRATELLQAALRIGMQLAVHDHHLLEDSLRPDIPRLPKRPPELGM